jgi:hypothetical protein
MKNTRPLTFPKDIMHQRFWKKVDVRGPDECWEWQSTKLETGYGIIRNIAPHKPAHLFAHRVSYYLTRDDPGPLYVRHTCDNPPCVNPTHLVLGTHQENMNDIKERGTRRQQGKLPPLEHVAKRNAEMEAQAREMLEDWLHGASYKEIADKRGLSEATVCRRLGSIDKPEERVEERKISSRQRAVGRPGLKGEAAPSAKLTDEIVLDMRRMYAAGAKQVEIRRKYPDYSEATVHRVVKRKNWKHLP